MLQNRVVEIAENHVHRARSDEDRDHNRAPIPLKAMPKLRPPTTGTVSLRPSTDVAPYRLPSSSIMWRPNVSFLLFLRDLPHTFAALQYDLSPVLAKFIANT